MADADYTVSAPSGRSEQNLSRVPYLPGLDGMRALAVVAVMIYHANSRWLSGGFLGVDVFFVISGYLITLLLMAERERTGRVNIVEFWKRRARRLLPALFVMLFLLLVYTTFFKSDTLGKLRGDLLGGLLYVSNWYQIWVGQGYSATGDFAPLRHLWSLGVEEQFYLVWPIVMMLILRRGGTRKVATTARWLVVAALAVTVVTAVLYHGGRIGECDVTPEAYWTIRGRCVSKADGLYLSTVTRSSGLLLGSAFAMVWRPVAIMRGPLRHKARLLDLSALIGLAALGLLCWRIDFITPNGASPWLFRGGLLLTGTATLFVIAAVTHRRTLTSRLLGNPVLNWVGTRSYGLYLYHWPIYQVIRKIAGNTLSLRQFAVAMIATGLLTELSYRFIETPIRHRQVGRWWSSLRRRRDPAPRQLVAGAVIACTALFAFGAVSLALADLKQNEIDQNLADNEDATINIEDLLPDGTPPAETAPTNTTIAPTESLEIAPELTTTTTSTTTTTTTSLPTEPIQLLALGDSVMQSAAEVLKGRGYTVDAKVSRQMVDLIPLMEAFDENDLFGTVVVVHLGTNGPISEETLNAFLKPMSDVKNVIILNVRASREWTASNNALLAARDSPGDNIILIDWATKSNECAGNCFADDGIHLSGDGQQFYANMIGDVTGI